MNLRVQVIIESEGGETTVQEVAHVERGAQRMEQLGLSLNEGNPLLHEIQRANCPGARNAAYLDPNARTSVRFVQYRHGQSP